MDRLCARRNVVQIARNNLNYHTGLEQAADDHREGAGACGDGLVEEQALEVELARESEDGADGAVLAGGADADRFGGGFGGGEFVAEGFAEQVDDVLGEGGEVGEGAFLDVAVLPVGLAEEVAGFGAVEGGSDVH